MRTLSIYATSPNRESIEFLDLVNKQLGANACFYFLKDNPHSLIVAGERVFSLSESVGKADIESAAAALSSYNCVKHIAHIDTGLLAYLNEDPDKHRINGFIL